MSIYSDEEKMIPFGLTRKNIMQQMGFIQVIMDMEIGMHI